MSGPGIPAELLPGALPTPQVAADGDQIAEMGLAAWERAKNSGRPSMEDVEAMIAYVLSAGPDGPEVRAITQFLRARGIKVPGVPEAGGDE